MVETNLSEPYVGPRPFERKDSNIFFGRNREANDLLSLITAHQIVLLYAKSGAGKSSLLNAKLIPMLETDGFEVLPVGRVRGLIARSTELNKVANIYVANALTYWAEGRVNGEQLSGMSFVDFLRRDHTYDEHHLRKPRVVILDQFEEIFTFAPDRWRDRKGVFEQLGKALAEDSLLRVVLAMREDFIAELDPYVSAVPEKLHTRFRLEPLREDAALAAVKGPLLDTQRQFAEGVAEKLVKNLLSISVRTAEGVRIVEGEYVEPVHLQVACRNLWENLTPSDDKPITDQDLETFGDVTQALWMFYEKAVERASVVAGVNEGRIRRWFERTLITTAGTRGLLFQSAEETGGLPNAAVDELEREHLINGKLRDGARWYELAHDRLIEPIKASNRNWLLSRSSAEEKRLELEEKADGWQRSNRSRSVLMDEADTVAAERWLASADAGELGYSDPLLLYVNASRAALDSDEQQKRIYAQRKSVRRLRAGIILAILLLLLTTGATVYALQQRTEANTQRNKAEAALAQVLSTQVDLREALVAAEAARTEADKLRQVAEQARSEESAQRKDVERAKADVENQKRLAEQERDKAVQARKEANEAAVLAESQRVLAEERADAARRAEEMARTAAREGAQPAANRTVASGRRERAIAVTHRP